MKQIFKLSTLLVAGLLFNSCSDSNDNGPASNMPDGLYIYSLEAETGKLMHHHAGDSASLLFYGDSDVVFSLENATLTVHPLSEFPPILRTDGTESVTTISKIWTEYPPKITYLPHIENGDPFISIPLLLSKESRVYDFYLTIENPEKGISCRTPNYRFAIHYEDEWQDMYKVTFETIH